MADRWAAFAALALATIAGDVSSAPGGASRWAEHAAGAVRGMTVGPIESALHPDRGYGSAACARAMRESRRMGATWVSLTPFGRVGDLSPTGVDRTFEAPFAQNRTAVLAAIGQAHAEGLRVLLVPHLWVESGEWRALIDPGDDAAWERWAAGYRGWLLEWARVAAEGRVDMFSAGVELRSWVTTRRAPTFAALLRDVRRVYGGPLTYAANWDDVHQTVILGDLDVIGINAFYPLAEKEGATLGDVVEGGRQVRARLRELADEWERPVLFTEIGYTNRDDPALRPWEWPDHMKDVRLNEGAQADAYFGLLAPLIDEEWFAGFFAWRTYADPDDMSQEAEWGFNPRGKEAELVLRDAFAARWAADGQESATSLGRVTETRVGAF